MTKIGVAGDWHGSFQWTRGGLRTLGEMGVKEVFHAGDFSIAFTHQWPDLVNISESVCKRYGMKLYITPGNHENWAWINSREYDADGFHWVSPHVAIVKRSTIMWVEGRTLVSLGGAVSVDRTLRRANVDYFPEEEIQYSDLVRLQKVKDDNPVIDIMVCHDAPGGGTNAVEQIFQIPPHKSIFPSEGIIASERHRIHMMEPAFSIVQPSVFVHGHFHAPDMKQVNDTLFMSLGCNGQRGNLGTIDLETLTGEMFDPDEKFFNKKYAE